MFDLYKDLIRTIYFAHANIVITFISWFSLTASFTLLYIYFDSILAAFLYGFGLQNVFSGYANKLT